MARREKVQALILGRRSYGEADRLVTLFTKEAGLMRVYARGVRKIPSRRGGHVEPFTQVLAVVTVTAGWRSLAHVETQDYFPLLRADATSYGHAQRLTGVLLQVLAEDQAHPELFDRLAGAWQALPQLSFAKQVLLTVATEFAILQAGGVVPNLSVCQRCGKSLAHEAVVLDVREGGWHCLSCHGGLTGTSISLPPRLMKALRYVAGRPQEALRLKIADEEAAQLLFAMQAYA